MNVVQVYGQEKIMVLKEIGVQNVSDPLLPHQVNCDVVCLVYDVNDEKSFEYAARIYIVSLFIFFIINPSPFRIRFDLLFRNTLPRVRFRF